MSAREWKPGDVALFTSAFNGSSTAIRVSASTCRGSACDALTHDHWHLSSGGFTAYDTHIHPLVVLNPDDREQVEQFTQAWREVRSADFTDEPWTVDGLRMQAALRTFANPQPRIEEPLGLGAVVVDDQGNRFTRVGEDSTAPWYSEVPRDTARPYRYFADLNIVRVLSEGVTA